MEKNQMVTAEELNEIVSQLPEGEEVILTSIGKIEDAFWIGYKLGKAGANKNSVEDVLNKMLGRG